MGIKLSEIDAVDKQSFIKCKYVAKDGSVLTKKYSYVSLSEAKRNFKAYIDINDLT
jgi:hypothetical protein